MKFKIQTLLALLLILTATTLYSKWETISMPENANLNKWSIIECYDGYNCIMVGYEFNNIPRVMVTTDAGKSWKYKLNRSKQDYINDHSLKYTRPISAYYDENIIILSCLEWNDHEPYIIRSFDSGETWEEFKITAPYAGKIYFEGDYGIMVAKNWIYESLDNGVNWELLKDISHLGDGFLKDYNFNSINEFSFLLENNDEKKIKICQTYDMGETWNIIEAPYISANMTYDFLNEELGYVTGQVPNGIGQRENAIIYKTIDGGVTWKEVLNKDFQNDVVEAVLFIDDVICIDENNAIAVGSDRLALLTTDGGSSWELITNGFENVTESSYLSTIEFIEPNIIIGGGWDNLIARIELEHLTSVNFQSTNNESFSIYPNPASDNIEIITKTSDVWKIEIYNMLGEKLLDLSSAGGGVPIYQDGGGQIRLDVSHLPAGLYLIKAGNRVQKFVKE